MGAGSIGCWLGGNLLAAGEAVHLVGRPRVLQALREHGLTLTDRAGGSAQVPTSALSLSEEVPAGTAPSLVLLCVKSGATAEAARLLAERLPAGTPVLSMQNGLSNVPSARQAAPSLEWLPGMVPYNVAELGPGRFHRGTEGELAAQDHPVLRGWLPRFIKAGLPMTLHADLAPVQWGKLLLNLNNAVNALSGLPLRAQLLQRDLRCCTAALIDETLGLLSHAGIRPAKMSPLPPGMIPKVLRLPTPLFRIVAARMLRIDEKARSSMADDLALGRPTEVDALQGEVMRLAQLLGLQAPVNQRIHALVQEGQGQPVQRKPLSGARLRALLDA